MKIEYVPIIGFGVTLYTYHRAKSVYDKTKRSDDYQRTISSFKQFEVAYTTTMLPLILIAVALIMLIATM